MCYSPWGCKELNTALQLNNNNNIFSQFSHSVLSNYVIPWTAACQASLSFTISQSLLKLLSIESVMASNHLILCPPLLFLPSIFSSISIFSNEWALHIRWPKYWSFSFSISPSNEYSEFISFRGLPLRLSWERMHLGSIPGLGRFPWRRERLPTPVFWPREFHGLYGPWDHKELDTTERTH